MWSKGKSTKNFGVCTRGFVYGQPEDDYYGILKEVFQLEYPGLPLKKLVLFNYEWFDSTPRLGTRIHKQYGIFEIRSTRRYNQYDPFILASQAHKVYYTPYLCRQRNLVDWWVVIQTKARSTVNAPTSKQTMYVYQEDEDVLLQPTIVEDEQLDSLLDNVEAEEVEEYSINDTFVVEDGEPDNKEEDEDVNTTERKMRKRI